MNAGFAFDGVDLVLDGPGVRLVLSAAIPADDLTGRGVDVEVSNEEQGQASLVLDSADVRQVRDWLDAWLTDYERAPLG